MTNSEEQTIQRNMIEQDRVLLQSSDERVMHFAFDPNTHVRINNVAILTGYYTFQDIDAAAAFHIDGRASKSTFTDCVFEPNIAYAPLPNAMHNNVRYAFKICFSTYNSPLPTTFDRCTFRTSVPGADYSNLITLVSVLVAELALVVFNDCTFYVGNSCKQEFSVMIREAGRVVFNNCRFIGVAQNDIQQRRAASIMCHNNTTIECNCCIFEGSVSSHIDASNLSKVVLNDCRFIQTCFNTFINSFVLISNCSFVNSSGNSVLRTIAMKNLVVENCTFEGKSHNLVQLHGTWGVFTNCAFVTTDDIYPVASIEGISTCISFNNCAFNAAIRCMSVSKFASARFSDCLFHAEQFSVTTRMYGIASMTSCYDMTPEKTKFEQFNAHVHVPCEIENMPPVTDKRLVQVVDIPKEISAEPRIVCMNCSVRQLYDAEFFVNRCGHFICSDCRYSETTTCRQCCIPICEPVKLHRTNVCAVCTVNKSMVVYGCGHMVVCITCAMTMHKNKVARCPYCNAGIGIKAFCYRDNA